MDSQLQVAESAPKSVREHYQYYDFLDQRLAQAIVSRTMEIIGCNVNIMDDRGVIIGSGDLERIGQLHEGALLALANGKMFAVNDSLMPHLQGVQPGINMPMRKDNKIVGVIGLTGNPDNLQQYAKLVTMTAEMMLEQSRLLSMLAQDQRLREELVLNLIRCEVLSDEQMEWAQRLSVDLSIPRIAVVIEIDSGKLPVGDAIYEFQHLLNRLSQPDHHNLVAQVSLNQIVVLKPALNRSGEFCRDWIHQRIQKLLYEVSQTKGLKLVIAMGHYFQGQGSICRSYNTADTTLKIGKIYNPSQQIYDYADLQLPVLLDYLHNGWQTAEFMRPLKRLKSMDTSGLLRKTLLTWFHHNTQLSSTAKALFIHRNTLEYRLNKVCELTSLNIRGNFFDRMLLYIGLQLDGVTH
ncbi:sugar diacid recognition domain-containing protein [Celerinatantimonas yamalensis]|uniref:Sugar diacid recognition domain-containing protein n=1 Tax=Celerinatantimonas yamalensis TaxID=559956 RepID=A0ABW9GB77_9GAMM